MFSRIKLQGLKKVLTLATSSTKKLVEAGVQGKDTFPELLAKYKWSGTRDFNMALIIIALYAYCLKKGGDLKDIAKKAINKGKSDEKGLRSTLGALRHGNGLKLAEYLEKDFDKDAQELIFKTDEVVDFDNINNDIVVPPIEKVFKNGLFKQAKKITKWKTNERDVDYCVNLLKGKIKDEVKNDELIFAAEMLKAKEKELKDVDETGDKLLHERAATIKELEEKLKSSKDIASSYYNQMDQHFTQSSKLLQQLEELKKERDNLQQELNKSNLTIEEQKKKIQEYETRKANSKLLFNNFMKKTDEIIQRHPNLNKEEVKEVKEKTKKLQKTIDNFALKDAKPFILSNGESFVPDINKNRRKSMGDIPTITIDEIKKARKNLKPSKNDSSSK